MAVILNHSPIPSRHITPMEAVPVKWLNPLSWWLIGKIVDRVMLPFYNPLRRKVGMKPYQSLFRQAWRSEELNLIAVSPELCVRPPDWPDSFKV